MLRITYPKSYRSFITSYRKAGIHDNFPTRAAKQSLILPQVS